MHYICVDVLHKQQYNMISIELYSYKHCTAFVCRIFIVSDSVVSVSVLYRDPKGLSGMISFISEYVTKKGL